MKCFSPSKEGHFLLPTRFYDLCRCYGGFDRSSSLFPFPRRRTLDFLFTTKDSLPFSSPFLVPISGTYLSSSPFSQDDPEQSLPHQRLESIQSGQKVFLGERGRGKGFSFSVAFFLVDPFGRSDRAEEEEEEEEESFSIPLGQRPDVFSFCLPSSPLPIRSLEPPLSSFCHRRRRPGP